MDYISISSARWTEKMVIYADAIALGANMTEELQQAVKML
jgi:hypothetical protein